MSSRTEARIGFSYVTLHNIYSANQRRPCIISSLFLILLPSHLVERYRSSGASGREIGLTHESVALSQLGLDHLEEVSDAVSGQCGD